MSQDRAHMAAIGREGGESRSAAARMARQGDREVPMSITREGMSDVRRPDVRPADRSRPDTIHLDGNSPRS